MITVEEAKSIIVENTIEIAEAMRVDAAGAVGFRLAADVLASIDLPPFNQSNVDGYAVRSSNDKTNSWKVIAEIKAGDNCTVELKEEEAVRIFTGAMVPAGSDCVIMQERITKNGDIISCDETPIKKGEHIRKKGAQIKAGEIALHKNTLIDPAVLGFISSLGLNKVSVFKKPKVSLIITGNELQETGTELSPGKVYESNSYSLSAALTTMGLKLEKIIYVKDDKKSLAEAVDTALQNTNLLLISGGISVGDYDFVSEVLKENNTTTLFYKVAQKPGKPLFFGKNKNRCIFGLPGNPASALTCFYEYVYPCLRKLQGRQELFLTKLMLPIVQDVPKKKGLANFLKAKASSTGVLPLEGQESFKMRSFADANAFIYLPLEKENVKAGELVEVHILPEL
ncbi:MAG: molybdopterin molybdotransferase MoeA [Bacteroidota bacterium]|nr:molybdopterin molybdotransferase MoeA [Bacteroidota bacterium]